MNELAEKHFRATHANIGRDWFRVQNAKQGKPAVVDIYDEIGIWGVTAKDFVKELRAITANRIELHINSPGGDVFDGVAILNALRDHPARITTTVDGVAASAASFVAMAGDEIVMARNSEMMIHDALGFAMGNSGDMRELAERMDKISNNIASVYAERAGGTVESWREAMRAETWYSAEEAVEAGLADRVAEKPDEKAAEAKNRFDFSIFNFAGREAAPAPTPVAKAGSTETPTGKGAAGMSDAAKLRETLRIGADVSDDEVTAALTAAGFVTAKAADPPPTPPAPQTQETDPADAPQEPKQGMVHASGTVILASSVWEQTQDTIKRLTAFVDKSQRDERDQVIAKAVADGKFTPAQKAHFSKLWDADPKGTKDLIDSLTKNSALAVMASGYAGEGDELDDDELAREIARLSPPAGRGADRG